MSLLKTAIEMGYECWYCGGKNGNDLVVYIEFDTPIHKSCAYNALKKINMMKK